MISFPFNSEITSYTSEGYPVYDRAVDASVMRKLFKETFSNGIYPNITKCLQVIENQGMKVTVKAGACMIDGALGYEEMDRTMSIEASDSQDRIDRVIARLNDNRDTRKIDLYILKGTPSASPQPPALTRNETVYDICLATLYINANSSEIKQTKITDTRLDSEVCGVVTVLTKVDTTGLYDQYQAALDAYLKLVDSAIDGTTAGNLQSQIDELKEVKELTLTTEWIGDDSTGYSQTVTVEGITESDRPLFDVKLVEGDKAGNEQKKAEYNKITDCWIHDGSITFYARDKTTIELTLLAKGV